MEELVANWKLVRSDSLSTSFIKSNGSSKRPQHSDDDLTKKRRRKTNSTISIDCSDDDCVIISDLDIDESVKITESRFTCL